MDFLLVAESGPGQTDEKGLIVPRFGNKPENHVAVSMSFEDLSELLLLTKMHYEAWLSAWYGAKKTKMGFHKPQMQKEDQIELPNNSEPVFQVFSVYES